MNVCKQKLNERRKQNVNTVTISDINDFGSMISVLLYAGDCGERRTVCGVTTDSLMNH